MTPTPAERSENEPPSQRARQKAETRRRLLIAATREFIEHGPTTAPLDAIAKRAGVSRPTLFFHFGSRDELMNEVAVYHLERYRSAWRQLRATDFRTYLELYLSGQRDPTVRLLWHLGDLLLQGRLVREPGGGTHHPPADHPMAQQVGYWDLVAELEERLVDAGAVEAEAHGRAVVLAPGLMMVARRAAQGIADEAEVKDFVDAACHLALGPGA